MQLEGRMLSHVKEMLPFNERRAEDCVDGRKSAGPSLSNAVFFLGEG